jgi:hypothetical protein
MSMTPENNFRPWAKLKVWIGVIVWDGKKESETLDDWPLPLPPPKPVMLEGGSDSGTSKR